MLLVQLFVLQVKPRTPKMTALVAWSTLKLPIKTVSPAFSVLVALFKAEFVDQALKYSVCD